MQIKVKKRPWGEGAQLVVLPQREERLWLAGAERLRDERPENFVPLTFSYRYGGGAKGTVLRYDITGMRTMRRYLKGTLTSEAYLSLLQALERAVDDCFRLWKRTDTALFDERHVFVDDKGVLRIVFVPFEGVVFDPQVNTPMTLLRRLGDVRHLSFEMASDVVHAENIGKYAYESRSFSNVLYHKFLNAEFADELPGPDGGVERWEHHGGEFPSERSTEGLVDLSRISVSDWRGEADVHGVANTRAVPIPAESVRSYQLRRARTSELLDLPMGRRLVVGRSRDCDVTVSGNAHLGRRQAIIQCSDEGITLMECGASNPTRAKGHGLAKGESVRLDVGERFSMGGEDFLVVARGS